MTRLHIASLLAAVPLVACTTTPTAPPSVISIGATDDPRFQNVLAYLEQQIEDHDIPGASIAIIENGQLIAAAGVGSKRDDDADQVDPSTLFRVGGLTKLVTASTAMSLVQDGTLALDHPVTDYVNLQLTAGYDPTSVQLGQLLDHTAGIPDISASAVCATGPGALAASILSDPQPLWTLPGQVWNFSNRGYGMAGWTIEGAAGAPYEQVVASRVFGPAGMTTATFDPVAASGGDYATGTTHDVEGNATPVEPYDYDCATTRPSSGVIASALDYASLAQTLLAGGGTMLNAQSVAALETGRALTYHTFGNLEQYGYGLYAEANYKGVRLLRHSGDDTGYQSALWIAPDQQFAVVVLYNSDGRAPSHVAARAFDQYLGTTNVTAPDETSPSSSWAAFAGSYLTSALGTVTVADDGGNLTISAPAEGVYDAPLAQVGGYEFELNVDTVTHDVTFVPDTNGNPWLAVSRDGVGFLETPAPTSPK